VLTNDTKKKKKKKKTQKFAVRVVGGRCAPSFVGSFVTLCRLHTAVTRHFETWPRNLEFFFSTNLSGCHELSHLRFGSVSMRTLREMRNKKNSVPESARGPLVSTLFFLCLVAVASAQQQLLQQQTFIKTNFVAPGILFGQFSAVCENASIAVVGALGESGVGVGVNPSTTAQDPATSNQTGAAFVYQRNGTQWTQVA
jgi:hypothetical protein